MLASRKYIARRRGCDTLEVSTMKGRRDRKDGRDRVDRKHDVYDATSRITTSSGVAIFTR